MSDRPASVKALNLSATRNPASSVDIGKLTQRGIGNILAIESANRNDAMKEILKAWDRAHPASSAPQLAG